MAQNSAKLIDVEALLPDDIGVKLPDGNVYRIPGDVPVPDVLNLIRITDRVQQAEDDAPQDTIQELNDAVIKLFSYRHPDFDVPMGVNTLFIIVSGVAEALGLTVQEMENQGPPQNRASRRSSTTRPSTRSRTQKK